MLVCEEAHRYIPSDKSLGFHATRRSISRIAKEGRKYGVSLCIISQRPSELEPSTLSQCSTIFSMRLTNELDQNFVKAAIPDGAGELLAFLPSLGTAETMVFGESVNLPMRVILDTLAAERRPHSSSAEFTDLWSASEVSDGFMDGVYESWRNRNFGPKTIAAAPPKPMTPAQPARDTRVPTSQIRNEHANITATFANDPHKSKIPAAPHNIADVKRMLNAAFHKNI